MTDDLDWARDLFDRTRGAGEPVWTADPAVLARAGDRRRRFRMAGAGGGLAGVVALTAAVAVGLGAGSTDLGSRPGPGGAWGNRPLSDVFKYAMDIGTVDKSGHAYVPEPAAVDLAALLGHVDPAFTHLVGSPSHANVPRIIAADDARAAQARAISLNSTWTDDTLRQSGQLSIGFASNSGWAQSTPVFSGIATDNLAAPCDLPFVSVAGAPEPKSTSSLPANWSSCATTRLPDGSTVASASARIGAGTASVVVRQFADGEVLSVMAQDFRSTYLAAAPDPSTVVQPTPWTAQSLAAALADPAIRSGWSPLSPPNADGKLLQPSDLGTGWSYDAGRADPGSTGDFVTTGCSAEVRLPQDSPGTDAYYRGPLPGEVPGTAYEGEFHLKRGEGAQAMAKVRLPIEGGCKDWPTTPMKDTIMPLPAGIGDDAFAVASPVRGSASVYVRVGDTILQAELGRADQTRNTVTPLDLSSAADQRWLVDLARSMVARHSGGAAHH